MDKNRPQNQCETLISNKKLLNNIRRVLTMLEKALNRLARQNYFFRSQYTKIFFDIEDALKIFRSWINDFIIFIGLRSFHLLLALSIKEFCQMIAKLIEVCIPLPGKKRIGKKQQGIKQNEIFKSVNAMLEHIAAYLDELRYNETMISVELEKWLYKVFEQHWSILNDIRDRLPVSSRGEKSYIFPWSDRLTYPDFVNDRNRFKAEVVERLSEYSHATGHKSSCFRSDTLH